MRDHRLVLWIIWWHKVFHQTSDWIRNRVWDMDARVAKADSGVGCRERHIRARFHIHAVEYRASEIATQVLQRLLTPHVADGVAPNVDRALVGAMLRTSIIGSARV